MPNRTVTNSGAVSTSPPPTELILNPQNPRFSKDVAQGVLKVDGVEYIRKKDKARKGDKPKAWSNIWKYTVALIRLDNKKELFYCCQCENDESNQTLPSASGTTNARAHLIKAHLINPDTGAVVEKQLVDLDASNEVVVTKSNSKFRTLLIRWFVCCQIAFFMLENKYFRELITYMNVALGSLLPKAASTIRQWILREYKWKKDELRKALKESLSKVHLSFDIWTAGNWIGVISIWAYWVDSAGKRQRRLLAFRRIYRSHSGESSSDYL